MLSTRQEVIAEIKRRYEGVEKLSKADVNANGKSGCFYGHSVNGVGCAIGCLVSAEDAAALDRIHDIFGGSVSVFGLLGVRWGARSAQGRLILGKYIDLDSPELTPDWFRRVQEAHDESKTVEEFLAELDEQDN